MAPLSAALSWQLAAVLLAPLLLIPSSAGLLVPDAVCKQACSAYPADAFLGTCSQECMGGCCISAWLAGGPIPHPGGCFSGATCPKLDLLNLVPCQACASFPAGDAKGICLGGRVPFLCRNNLYVRLFAVVSGLRLVIGNCTVGSCSAAAAPTPAVASPPSQTPLLQPPPHAFPSLPPSNTVDPPPAPASPAQTPPSSPAPLGSGISVGSLSPGSPSATPPPPRGSAATSYPSAAFSLFASVVLWLVLGNV